MFYLTSKFHDNRANTFGPGTPEKPRRNRVKIKHKISLHHYVIIDCTQFSVKKNKLHKALRSVQFLASFTNSYFEILSYLACSEKIIRLASKNSVKLDEKSAGDF